MRDRSRTCVGAGPGDPGLLTRRGEELLRRADVVVYDRLASPSLLDLAPAAAELVDVGKAPGRAAMTQEQINEVLVARGREGKAVVRLKGGDPFVFGRGRRRSRSVHRAPALPFEVVPGVTERDRGRRVRGHPGDAPRRVDERHHRDRPRRSGQGHDRHRLGRRSRSAGGTLVILMGAGNLPRDRRGTHRGRARAGHAGRRGALGHTARAAHDPRHAGDDRRRRRRSADRDRRRRRRRPRFRVVRTPTAVRPTHRRDARARAGERAAHAPRIARCRRDRAARRSRSSRSTFTRARSRRSTRGSSSRRPMASTRSSTAGSAATGLDARALAPVRVAAIGPGTTDALARTRHPRRSRPRALRRRVAARGVSCARRRARGAARRAPRPRATCCPTGSTERGYDVDVLPVYRTVPATPDADDARPRARGQRRCDHVHVVVDRRELLRPRRTAPGSAAARRVDRPGHVGDGAASAGLRVDAEADPHTIDGLVDRAPEVRSPREFVADAGTLTAWRSPNADCADCGAPRRCAGWSPSTALAVDDLVAPLFVKEGIDAPEPIVSMPGVVQHTQESLRKEVRALADLGVPGVMLFGIPAHEGRPQARRPTRPTASCRSRCATSATKSATRSCSWPTTASTSTPTTATAACSPPAGEVDNDATLERYASIAVAQADAGADVIAPRGMMDGQVGAIRAALDDDGPRARRRSSRTRRSTRRRSTARSATPPSARRSSATGAATRWTPPTVARRSPRSRSTSTKAPTW